MSLSGPPGVLALEDGTVFRGISFGATGTMTGEVCFNTGMTGYQEVLTDPSYQGQIVTMTAPHIGNTGCNDHDDQSRHPWVAGFVVRELSPMYSSWRAEGGLPEYLERHGIPGLTEIDTRRLTRHIRSLGAMRGVLTTSITDADEAIDRARNAPDLVGRDLVREVTTETPYRWDQSDLTRRAISGFAAGQESGISSRSLMTTSSDGPRYRIAALDFGIKRNILDLLVAAGNDVTVLPASTPAREILAGDYAGVFLSNGPGDPAPVDYAIETVGELLGKLPIFGICLGHQILALALGATTYKLPFGHRGSNHPVQQLGQDRVEITCQNHGFAVAEGSIAATGARLTHTNLNDLTVEGLELPGVAFSVQYHPESGPGPHDSRYLFERFRAAIETFEPATLPARV